MSEEFRGQSGCGGGGLCYGLTVCVYHAVSGTRPTRRIYSSNPTVISHDNEMHSRHSWYATSSNSRACKQTILTIDWNIIARKNFGIYFRYRRHIRKCPIYIR